MKAHTLNPGHWPQFSQIICGEMSERERLGLPEHWIAARWAEAFQDYHEAVRGQDRETLLQWVEDSQIPLPLRIVAGQILALIGDSRLNTLNPAMIALEGGSVEIGLDFQQVDTVLKVFDGLGLDRTWIEKECPRHSVTVKPYAIGKYPVTNQEYRDFLADTQLDMIPIGWNFRRFPMERANHPVYTVTAEMADAYCAWLRERTGKPYRLPTESEWEYAASTEGYEFPWGDEFRLDHANTAELGLFDSTPVGVFVEGNTSMGIADMAGNVEEYVADDYKSYPGGIAITDHLTKIHGNYRVARGGSFARFRDLARTRRRHGYNPNSSVYAMGFRLACDLS